MDREELLAVQSEHVRNLYCLGRRRFMARLGRTSAIGLDNQIPSWDGGTDSNGRTYVSVWPKVVKFCLANNLSPAVLVRSVFANSHMTYPPAPNKLYGPAALQMCQAGMAAVWLSLKQDLVYFSNQADVYFRSFTVREDLEDDPVEAWRMVVSRDPPQLSTLYRYCLAKKGSYEDLAAKYKATALAEYMWSKDEYDKVWAGWIPSELSYEAGEIMSGLSEAVGI